MKGRTDQQLLREYCANRSEAGFSELVRRHIDLVYSTSLRVVRDAHLAEDVTQRTFAALAQNARRLQNCEVLAGWLHRTAHNIGANVVRSETRRNRREQQAVAMSDALSHESPDGNWDEIAPHLDAALEQLNERDRDVILLRYFDRKSAREIAHLIGITEAAAQKRASRAVEELRAIFSRRGVTIGATSLTVLLTGNAVQTAPLLLTQSVLATTTTAAASTVIATKIIAMSTVQKTIMGTFVAAALVTALYEVREASTLREQLEAAHQRKADWENEKDRQAAEIDRLTQENDRLKGNFAELAKLRGEVTRLRSKEQQKTVTVAAAEFKNATDQPKVTEIPKTSWIDAGFDTPEAALQTRGWAIVEADREKFKESIVITDEARKVLLDMLDKMAAASPDGAKWKEQTEQAGLGVEDAFLMPMIAEDKQKGYTGFRILSQQSPGENEVTLEVETQMLSAQPKKEFLKLQRFGGDWKFVIDEEFLQERGIIP